MVDVADPQASVWAYTGFDAGDTPRIESSGSVGVPKLRPIPTSRPARAASITLSAIIGVLATTCGVLLAAVILSSRPTTDVSGRSIAFASVGFALLGLLSLMQTYLASRRRSEYLAEALAVATMLQTAKRRARGKKLKSAQHALLVAALTRRDELLLSRDHDVVQRLDVAIASYRERTSRIKQSTGSSEPHGYALSPDPAIKAPISAPVESRSW